jgi:hypothetical protein
MVTFAEVPVFADFHDPVTARETYGHFQHGELILLESDADDLPASRWRCDQHRLAIAGWAQSGLYIWCAELSARLTLQTSLD